MKKEDKEKIKQISIRGRYAIGLICLEKGLKKFKIEKEELIELVNDMWQVTSSEKLGLWFEFLIEQNPELIIADYQLIKSGKISFQQAGYDTIKDEIELKKRYDLFKDLPLPIRKIFTNLKEIANSNLYGGCGEFSEITYNYTINLLELIEELQDVEAPNIELFMFSKFSQNNGWGDKFKKERIKNI